MYVSVFVSSKVVGMRPERLLCERSSSWRFCRELSCDGISPSSSLWLRSRFMAWRFEKESKVCGIWELKLFEDKSRTSSLVKKLICAGTLPDNRLPFIRSFNKPVRFPIASGSSPVRLLVDISSSPSCFMFQISGGIAPVRLLFDMIKATSFRLFSQLSEISPWKLLWLTSMKLRSG